MNIQKNYRIEYILFYLFLLIKPFYLKESGTMQAGDVLLVLSVVWWLGGLIARKQWKNWRNHIEGIDILLVAFVLCTAVVNCVGVVRYGDTRFILSSLYLAFCTMAVVVFRAYLKNSSFRSMVYGICTFNVMMQFVLLITGVGRYLFEHRYVGSFNDPNQLGFFLLASMFMMSIFTKAEQKKRPWNILVYLCGLFLIILSKSTGVALGLAIWWLGEGILALYRWGQKERISPGKMLGIGAGLFGVILVLCGIGIFMMRTMQLGDEYNLFVRIGEKFELLWDGGFKSLCASRGIDRMWQYPWNNLFGAGEGAFYRFELSQLVNTEIHSSFLSILFCYGVFPFMLVVIWVYKNIRKVPLELGVIYLAFFAECFVLINYRQPLFWMLFVTGQVSQGTGFRGTGKDAEIREKM